MQKAFIHGEPVTFKIGRFSRIKQMAWCWCSTCLTVPFQSLFNLVCQWKKGYSKTFICSRVRSFTLFWYVLYTFSRRTLPFSNWAHSWAFISFCHNWKVTRGRRIKKVKARFVIIIFRLLRANVLYVRPSEKGKSDDGPCDGGNEYACSSL